VEKKMNLVNNQLKPGGKHAFANTTMDLDIGYQSSSSPCRNLDDEEETKKHLQLDHRLHGNAGYHFDNRESGSCIVLVVSIILWQEVWSNKRLSLLTNHF
jgi:hypothetical protein